MQFADLTRQPGRVGSRCSIQEITVASLLLRSRDLRRKVVMGDASLTRQESLVQIDEAGEGYVRVVKDTRHQ